MVVTAANVEDVTQVYKLLYGAEYVVCASVGYTGESSVKSMQVSGHLADRSSAQHLQDAWKCSGLYKANRKIEKAKTQVRVKGEHPFRMINRSFEYSKVGFRKGIRMPRIC